MRRILILDADIQSLEAATHALNERHFKVEHSGDFSEAIRACRRDPADIVVCDRSLPLIESIPYWERRRGDSRIPLVPRTQEGYALLRPLELDSSAARFPIVALKLPEEIRDGAQRFGVVDFAAKPLDPRDLVARVRAVLESSVVPIHENKPTNEGSKHEPVAWEGRIGPVAMPELLQMCHVGRLSGKLTLRHDDTSLGKLFFWQGEIVNARLDGSVGTAAVFALMGWEQGRFAFVPGTPKSRIPLETSFDQILLEGCRRLDETTRQRQDATRESFEIDTDENGHDSSSSDPARHLTA